MGRGPFIKESLKLLFPFLLGGGGRRGSKTAALRGLKLPRLYSSRRNLLVEMEVKMKTEKESKRWEQIRS